jgi:hypothetical protein
MTWAGHKIRERNMTDASKALVRKPEKKRPFRGRFSLEDNIKTRSQIKLLLLSAYCHLQGFKSLCNRAENSPSLYNARAKYAKRLFQAILT